MGNKISYAWCSHRGIIRPNNEDTISHQSMSLLNPHTNKRETVIYFGVFDGHGGKSTALYLKKHLHQLIFD